MARWLMLVMTWFNASSAAGLIAWSTHNATQHFKFGRSWQEVFTHQRSETKFILLHPILALEELLLHLAKSCTKKRKKYDSFEDDQITCLWHPWKGMQQMSKSANFPMARGNYSHPQTLTGFDCRISCPAGSLRQLEANHPIGAALPRPSIAVKS